MFVADYVESGKKKEINIGIKIKQRFPIQFGHGSFSH
jgi:hypothetical protein